MVLATNKIFWTLKHSCGKWLIVKLQYHAKLVLVGGKVLAITVVSFVLKFKYSLQDHLFAEKSVARVAIREFKLMDWA